MIKIAFCDDSEIEREILKNIVSEIVEEMHQEAVIFEFSSGEKLSRNYSCGDYDIVFLDIQMKQQNGIETGKLIRSRDAFVDIVYATCCEDYFKEGFGVHALAYILKPYNVEQIRETLDYYFRRNNIPANDSKEMLDVTIQQKKIFIKQKDIYWLESMGRIVNIYCKNNVYKMYARLSDVEKKLDTRLFLRCNQSYIINIAFVDDIRGYDFCLISKKLIPIRKRDKKEIIQKYYNKRNELEEFGALYKHAIQEG